MMTEKQKEFEKNLIERGAKDLPALQDAFEYARALEDHEHTGEIRKYASRFVKNGGDAQGLELYRKALLFDAQLSFDCFLRYVECRRDPSQQFYAPRRHYLLPIVQAYQAAYDGKLKLLTISLPKRAGKSQTGINYVNWLSGKHPDRSTLMEGTGDDLVKSFYTGCLEYLQEDSPYAYYDVFPECRLVQTNADTKIINLNEKSRFPTVMCRSIDARQVGLSEATNVLYMDDCVEGREEAKNRERLDAKWEVISGDIMGRAIECPMIFTGTRYSLYDPIGRIQEYARKMGWAWKAIEIPALDPVTDESNYEYYNPKLERWVFTTGYFREQRELLSAEQFESEFQQQPFEAKGLLFPEKSLNRYFALPPDRDPDAVVAICDTAERGADSTAMGIFKIYGEDVFLDDVVFDNSAPEITKPQCAKKIVEHGAGMAVFESNNAGEYFARDVEALVKEYGGKCSIRTKRTISNKQTRIEYASDGILKHFYFKDASTYQRNSQYALFLRELTTYTRSGKVPHDDAPDMLSLAENEFRNLNGNRAEVVKRVW
ncbi:MAG: phage terminase large subunit [Oscillospiraceae bacterium]|nr:phage terminase large subunit [Oscillospiraceae bacterium]